MCYMFPLCSATALLQQNITQDRCFYYWLKLCHFIIYLFFIKILLTDVILKQMKHMILFLSSEILHITWIISDALSICDFFFHGMNMQTSVSICSRQDMNKMMCYTLNIVKEQLVNHCQNGLNLKPMTVTWFTFCWKQCFPSGWKMGIKHCWRDQFWKFCWFILRKKQQLLSSRSLWLVTSQHCHKMYTVNTMTIQKLSDYVDFFYVNYYMIWSSTLDFSLKMSQKAKNTPTENAMITMLVFPVTTVAGISSYEEWLTAWWNAMHINA